MNPAILKYPFPFKARLAMANDPDNTNLLEWKELHAFIWEELKLPFGDSLFVRSFNANLPTQVDLEDNPEIGMAHLHDIIHTWGDYMHGRKRGFDREDAIEAAKTLTEAGIKPKVWIDHASFVGNMIHGTKKGATDKLVDSSGHVYQNFLYSLDIARELGIRYIWNGEVTSVAGQDRKLGFSDYQQLSGGSQLKASAKSVLQQLPGVVAAYSAPDNRQYYIHEFKDGSKLYCFRRYGTWQDADIDGLNNLINPDKLAELLQSGGTSIVYSHLGKKHSKDSGRANHIPDSTRESLRNLKAKFDSKEIMVSSVSTMLNYLVLRDRVEIDTKSSVIRFKADGITFQELTVSNLAGMRFSFKKKGLNMDTLTVYLDQELINPTIQSESEEIFSIVF